MDFEKASFLVQSRFGGAVQLKERIQVEMELAQQTLENTHPRPWFLVVIKPVVINYEGYIYVPKGFLAEWNDDGDGCFWFTYEGVAVPIPRLEWRNLFAKYGGVVGFPVGYDFLGDTFNFAPAPAEGVEYSGFMKGYFADAPIANGVENKWLKYAPDLLIAHTGLAIAQYTHEQDKIGVFREMIMSAQSRLARDTVARNEANRERRIGPE